MPPECEVLTFCCVCLCKDSHTLFKVTHFQDENNNTWISKLRKCISEIEWAEDYLICKSCTEQLNFVYNFHVLCLQSNLVRQRILRVVITPDIKSDNPFGEDAEHKCQNVSEKTLLESQVRTDTEKSFSKVCCLDFGNSIELDEHHEKLHKEGENSDTCMAGDVSNHDSEQELSTAEPIQEKIKKKVPRKQGASKIYCADSSSDNSDSDPELSSLENKSTVKHKTKRKKRNTDFTCELCKLSFNTSPKLVQHAINEHKVDKKDVKPFACTKCSMRFNKSWGLTKHLKSHDRLPKETKENYNFICDVCKSTFKTSKDFVSHSIIEHKIEEKNVKPFSCLKCNKRFINSWRLKEHSKSHDRTDTINIANNLQGVEINHVAETRSQQNSEIVDIETKKKMNFECEICKSTFHYCTELVKHSVAEHKMDKKDVRPFVCTQCPKRFDKNTLLIQHLKFHEGIRNAICPYCGKGFITKGELHIHEKTHLNKREYQCTLCPKRFNTSGDRNRHKLVVHTDPSFWKYVCNICSKRLPSKSHYDTHMRRHNNDKPFACHLCEKKFCDKIVLQKHLRSHSNVRPYKCSECEKEYKDERTMQLHMARIHKTGNIKVPERVKKYICHLCPKSYYDKGKLTKHLYSHTGERPFACTICNKKFTDKSYVKHHMKTVHNFIPESTETSQ